MFAAFMIIYILIYVVIGGAQLACTIIGKWKCLQKAGEKGWKALIPFYNWAVLYKISGMSPYWLIVYVAYWAIAIFSNIVSIVAIEATYEYGNEESFVLFMLVLMLILMVVAIGYLVVYIIWCIKFCKSFNKGVGFVFGMIFVPVVFFMIIGLGNSKYVGDNELKNTSVT